MIQFQQALVIATVENLSSSRALIVRPLAQSGSAVHQHTWPASYCTLAQRKALVAKTPS